MYMSTHEILRPYAGIIRIRSMGMISAPKHRDTPANNMLYSILFLYKSYLVKLRPVLAGKIYLLSLRIICDAVQDIRLIRAQ